MKRYSLFQITDSDGERFGEMKERPDGEFVKHAVIEEISKCLLHVEAFLEAALRDARDAGDPMDIECAMRAHELHRRAMEVLAVRPWPSPVRLIVAPAGGMELGQ